MILIVGDDLGRHLAAALRAHVRELRLSGLPVPASLAELAAVAATGGQTRPAFDSPEPGDDPAHVDQLALNYRATAARLGVSDRSVRRLVAEGKLPAVEVAGCTRIRVRDIENYVDGLAPVNREAA